jgi:hypothetical protein
MASTYPIPSDLSQADTVRFAKLEEETKTVSPGDIAAAAVPYSYPVTIDRVPAYASNLANALHGLKHPPRQFPPSTFAPLTNFPAAREIAPVPRGYDATRNPYGYRGGKGEEMGWEVDSEEEEELISRIERARKTLDALDDEAHVDPRIEFDPGRGGRFKPLSTTPPRGTGYPPRPMQSHEQLAYFAAAASAVPSMHRAMPADESVHRRGMAPTRDFTPFKMTPSISPAQTETRPSTEAAVPSTKPTPVKVLSAKAALSPEVASLPHRAAPGPGVRPSGQRRHREAIDDIWEWEEEMELINRRRILAAQLFQRETQLNEAAMEKKLMVEQMNEVQRREAEERQRRREAWRDDVRARTVHPDAFMRPAQAAYSERPSQHATARTSQVHSPVLSTTRSPPIASMTPGRGAAVEEEFHTPLQEGSMRESQRQGLSMDALETPAVVSHTSRTSISHPSRPSFLPPAASPDDDVPEWELAAYRAYILRTDPSGRSAREEEARLAIERARGVDKLETSEAFRREQNRRESEVMARAARIVQMVKTTAPHPAAEVVASAAQPVLSPPRPVAESPPQPHLSSVTSTPLVLQRDRPGPLSSVPPSSRQAFRATLKTTPPDSPRAVKALVLMPSALKAASAEKSPTKQSQVEDRPVFSPVPSPSTAGSLLSPRPSSSDLLRDHDRMASAIAVEEDQWRHRTERGETSADWKAHEQKHHEQIEAMHATRAREAALLAEQAAARTRLSQLAHEEALAQEKRFAERMKRMTIKAEKVAEETAEARAQLAAQRQADREQVLKLEHHLQTQKIAYNSVKAASERASAALSAALVAQQVVSSRYARFEQDALGQQATERRERNELMKLAHEEKLSETERRRKRLEEVQGEELLLEEERSLAEEVKRDYFDATGEDLSEMVDEEIVYPPSARKIRPHEATPSERILADPEWHAVKTKVATMLSPEDIARLPEVPILVEDSPAESTLPISTPIVSPASRSRKITRSHAEATSPPRSLAAISRDMDDVAYAVSSPPRPTRPLDSSLLAPPSRSLAAISRDLNQVAAGSAEATSAAQLDELQELKASIGKQQRELLAERLQIEARTQQRIDAAQEKAQQARWQQVEAEP